MSDTPTARLSDARREDGPLASAACPAACGTHLKERTVLNYPGHWAGLGLLLLRGTVGITVAIQAWLSVASANTDLLAAIPAAVLVVCGVALTIGIFTSICSTLVALGYALVLLLPFGGAMPTHVDGGAAVVGLAAAVAIGVLGPGAFSVDARLFGRRAIFIPARDGSD